MRLVVDMTKRIASLLTQQQLADLLGISERSLERWRSEQQGPPYVPLVGGGTIRYRLCDVEQWLEDQLVRPTRSHVRLNDSNASMSIGTPYHAGLCGRLNEGSAYFEGVTAGRGHSSNRNPKGGSGVAANSMLLKIATDLLAEALRRSGPDAMGRFRGAAPCASG